LAAFFDMSSVFVDDVDQTLTLDGLRLIHERNRR
jgi:hypothetical protein